MMSEVLRVCSRYLAIVAAGSVCLAIGAIVSQPRPLQYFENCDVVTMVGGLAASFTIFTLGTIAARNLK